MQRARILPSRHVANVVGDLTLVSWIVLWWFLARWVGEGVRNLANPVHDAASTTQTLANKFADAAAYLKEAPLVGEHLAKPFGPIAETLQRLAGGAATAGDNVVVVSAMLFWVIWLVPIVVAAGHYLPWRVKRALAAVQARNYINSGGELDLFAVRALTDVPIAQLARASASPTSVWRTGDRSAIGALTRLQLRRVGVELLERNP